MRFFKKLVLVVFTFLLAAFSVASADTSLALIVQSKGNPALKDGVINFRELMASDLSGEGFEVIDPSVVTETLGHYGAGNIERADEAAQSGKSLDALINENTTAIRLAQNMGAAYLIHASLISFDTATARVSSYGIDSVVRTYTLRVAVKIVDGTTGIAVTGKTVEVSEKAQDSANLQTDDSGILNRLYAKASQKIAQDMQVAVQNKGGLQEKNPVAEDAPLSIIVTMHGMNIPLVSTDASGAYVVANKEFPVEATGVMVQLDGIVIGTAPGSFQVAPGLHSLTLTRDDFHPVTRTIKVLPKGTSLNISMELSDAATAKWAALATFVSNLKESEKLNDAKAEEMKGIAKMFSQSGFRVDIQRAADGKGDISLDMSNHNRVTQINQIAAGMKGMGFGDSMVLSAEAGK